MLKDFGEYEKILETLINAKDFFYQTHTSLFREWVEVCDHGLYTLQIHSIFQKAAKRHHLSEKHAIQDLLLAFLETATTPFELYINLSHHPQKTILTHLIEALDKPGNYSALIRMQTQFQNFAVSQRAYEQRIVAAGEQKAPPPKAPLPASIAHAKQMPTNQSLPDLVLPTKEKPKKLAQIEMEIPKLPALVKLPKPSGTVKSEQTLRKKEPTPPTSPTKTKLKEAHHSPPLRAKQLPARDKGHISSMSFLFAAQEAAQKDQAILAAGQKVLSRYTTAQQSPQTQQHSPPSPKTSITKKFGESPSFVSQLCVKKLSY
jgi:hypothetical protein